MKVRQRRPYPHLHSAETQFLTDGAALDTVHQLRGLIAVHWNSNQVGNDFDSGTPFNCAHRICKEGVDDRRELGIIWIGGNDG